MSGAPTNSPCVEAQIGQQNAKVTKTEAKATTTAKSFKATKSYNKGKDASQKKTASHKVTTNTTT